MQHLSKDKVRTMLAQPNGTERLNAKPEAALQAAWALFAEENNAAACGFLCAAAKKKAIRENIARRLQEDRTPLYAALGSEASKMRKNAARLCGALADPADAETLAGALAKEDTRYVRPSLLLALGAVGGDLARDTLMRYSVELGDPKHMSAEKEALMMARARCVQLEKHSFRGFAKPLEIELRCPRWLSEPLAFELREAGLTPRRTYTEAVLLKTADTARLFQARGFFEILFPLGRCGRSLAEVAAACAPFADFLESCHEGKPPFAYRIELKGSVQERAAFAKGLASLLDGERLHNAPSAYEAELRVEFGSKNAKIYAKLYTLEDTRFHYRLETLPASIHPATAAAVLRSARDFLKSGARVLDPCCGSGTMLFERERLSPCEALTGVDIAHAAVEAARANAEAGASMAKFIVNDALRFEAKRPYDEVIANLPFGNRVGSHELNERLYAGLLGRLPQWLAKDGVALFYTMEYTLLKRLIAARTDLRLLLQGKTDAGGLTPGIFIVKRAEG